MFPDLSENTTPPAPKYVCDCVHVRNFLTEKINTQFREPDHSSNHNNFQIRYPGKTGLLKPIQTLKQSSWISHE